MKYIAIALPLLFSGAALSQPTVNEGTITVPNDGWYQIQRTDNYATVCQGKLSCEVAVGSYIVINHTTGERFTDVIVASSLSEPSGSVVEVTGNTLSWPANGWYQVQSMSDYSTVCEGTLFCEVSEGSYVVINHSTGERYENIQVGSSEDVPSTVTEISVEGNVISWPDNGWYQVQTADDYQALCNGGTFCEVPVGRYIVINHSTGDRFENITVGGGSPAPVTEVATPDNTQIAGIPYKTSRVWLNNVVSGQNLYSGASFDSYLSFALNSSLVGSLSVGSTNDCAAGGTVSYESESESRSSGFSSFSSVKDTFNYVNCAITEGTVNGVISVTTLSTISGNTVTTDFNVTTNQSSVSAILMGRKITTSNSSTNFNNECGTVANSSDSFALALNNSTVSEITDSGLETHYYAILDHQQDNDMLGSCTGVSRSSRYSSSASYTHTNADRMTRVEASKSGVVSSELEEFDESSSASTARLIGIIDTPEGSVINITIAATDSLGNVLDVGINGDQGRIEFSEDHDFRDLSSQ